MATRRDEFSQEAANQAKLEDARVAARNQQMGLAPPASPSTLAPAPAADGAPVINPSPRVCATCHGFRAMAVPAFGQCLPSKRCSPAPLIRTDLDSCSLWPAEAYKGQR